MNSTLGAKPWRVESWYLRDLANLMVGLKTEWNANYQDFEKITLLKEGSVDLINKKQTLSTKSD